jgi:ParB-like chromosome segregation protein Spo0J
MAQVIPSAEFNTEIIPGVAKAALAAAGAKAETNGLFMVPVDVLRVIEGFNVRVTGTKDYEAGIAELANSILQEGFYKDKPLVGYVGKDGDADVIYLTDGHRRLEAVKRAIAGGAKEIERVPVIVKPSTTNMVDLTVALAKTGTPLTPYEMAIIVKRLAGYGVDEGQIALRLGVTKRYVADLQVLLSAPAKVRSLVMDGKVSATLAIQAMREDAGTAAEKLTEAVKNAKALGLDRATGKHVNMAPPGEGGDGEPKEKPKHKNPKPGKAGKFVLAIKGKAGDKLKLTEIALFAGVQGGAWYTANEKDAKTVILTQPINLKITGTFGDLVEPAAEGEGEGEGGKAPTDAEGL